MSQDLPPLFLTRSLPKIHDQQLSMGLHQVRSELVAPDQYNPEPFTESYFQRYLFRGLPPHKLSAQLTKHLKTHLTRKLLELARTFLRARLAQVPWHFATLSSVFDSLHVTPTRVIPSFARLAMLGYRLGAWYPLPPPSLSLLQNSMWVWSLGTLLLVSRRVDLRCSCRLSLLSLPHTDSLSPPFSLSTFKCILFIGPVLEKMFTRYFCMACYDCLCPFVFLDNLFLQWFLFCALIRLAIVSTLTL